jgi:hypothetical protein
MIPRDLSHTVTPHVWPNASHRNFRERFLCLNTSTFLLHTSQSQLRQTLIDQLHAMASRHGNFAEYAMGVITAAEKVDDNVRLRGLHVAKDDAWYVADNTKGFLDLVQRQALVSAHRIMVDYCFDLVAELIAIQALTVGDDVHRKICDRNLSISQLPKLLTSAGVWFPVESDLPSRLHLLAETRNCIEHDGGLASDIWPKLAGRTDVQVGAPLPISADMVSDALDHVDAAANLINCQAIQRFLNLRLQCKQIDSDSDVVIHADWRHAIQAPPVVPVPYHIAPAQRLSLDASALRKEMTKHASSHPINEVQVRVGQHYYSTAFDSGKPIRRLDESTLRPLRGAPAFSGLLPRTSLVIAIGSSIPLFHPFWAARVYVGANAEKAHA